MGGVPTRISENCILTISTSTGGFVEVNGLEYVDPLVLPSLSNPTLEAIPERGKELYEWSGDLTGNTNPISVVMNADKNITANFISMTFDTVNV